MNSTATVGALSRLPDKLKAFAADPYFRDAWDDVVGVSTDETEISRLLHDAAVLVLRPDTLLAGRPVQVLRAVFAAGFRPVATAWFAFTRHVIRETWRYQLNIATRDRIDVMDLVLRGEQALYVLLEHRQHLADMPATTLLSGMKGPSAPEDREPSDLRVIAGAAQESVLTYVHVADEPADILRELGIFFDRPHRLRLFSALGKGLDVSAAVFAEVEIHRGDRADLDFDRALRRTSELAGRLPKVVAEEIGGLVERAAVGRPMCWRSLLELIDRHGLPVSRWDRAAIGARLGARHLDGTPVVPDIAGYTGRES